jgi:dTDP-4-dehydrorhamnose reductase
VSGPRILVAGRSGQVARSLVEAAEGKPGLELISLGRPELDIADHRSAASAVKTSRPDVLINAAAYTGVDLAETETAAAYRANETGPAVLGRTAAEAGIPIVHLSTDYVFDGSKGQPYREEDPVSPLGVYGASKWAGEQRLAEIAPKHLILRTAWVYGAYGKNFLKTMLRVGAEREVLNVVCDQRGAPTSSHDIALALLKVASALVEGEESYGIYHMTAKGEASWADFAEAIFEASAARGGPAAKVEKIRTEDYPTPAERPQYSVLDSTRLKADYGVDLPQWQEPVASVVGRVLNEKD